jgi:predicted DNA-binding transcriptional regulator AlpA
MLNRTPTRAAATRHNPADSAPSDAALLVDVHGLGRLLACSARHCEDLAREGALPEPVKLGRLSRWRVSEIRAWVEAGCLNRAIWEAKKAAGSCEVARPNGGELGKEACEG